MSTPLLIVFLMVSAVPLMAQDAVPAAGYIQTAAAKSVSPENASALPGMEAQQPANGVPAALQKIAQEPSLMDAEWGFIKARGSDKDEDVLSALLPQAEDWLTVYPAAPYSGEAQLLKATLRLKLGDYKPAIMDLLRHFYEYPASDSSAAAKKIFNDTLEKKTDKKVKPVLADIADSPASGETSEKLAALLDKASARAGEFLYEPLLGEYRAFFRRFPQYAGNDALRLDLADLHLKKEEYLRAKLAYEKMIEMHPSSPLMARAKNSLAAALADNLKEYDNSINVYQDIAASFPGTAEAWTAYSRLPVLTERQKKYDLAVEIYEKIIALYPDKDEAYSSFVSEARVLREEMKKPDEAVNVLNRLADKYKGPKAIDALFLAAEIARKDMKDSAVEVATYDRIVVEYPMDPQAPRAIFAAGEVYEKAKDYEKARDYYASITGKYPEDPLAKKAQKRIDGLLAR